MTGINSTITVNATNLNSVILTIGLICLTWIIVTLLLILYTMYNNLKQCQNNNQKGDVKSVQPHNNTTKCIYDTDCEGQTTNPSYEDQNDPRKIPILDSLAENPAGLTENYSGLFENKKEPTPQIKETTINFGDSFMDYVEIIPNLKDHSTNVAAKGSGYSKRKDRAHETSSPISIDTSTISVPRNSFYMSSKNKGISLIVEDKIPTILNADKQPDNQYSQFTARNKRLSSSCSIQDIPFSYKVLPKCNKASENSAERSLALERDNNNKNDQYNESTAKRSLALERDNNNKNDQFNESNFYNYFRGFFKGFNRYSKLSSDLEGNEIINVKVVNQINNNENLVKSQANTSSESKSRSCGCCSRKSIEKIPAKKSSKSQSISWCCCSKKSKEKIPDSEKISNYTGPRLTDTKCENTNIQVTACGENPNQGKHVPNIHVFDTSKQAFLPPPKTRPKYLKEETDLSVLSTHTDNQNKCQCAIDPVQPVLVYSVKRNSPNIYQCQRKLEPKHVLRSDSISTESLMTDPDISRYNISIHQRVSKSPPKSESCQNFTKHVVPVSVQLTKQPLYSSESTNSGNKNKPDSIQHRLPQTQPIHKTTKPLDLTKKVSVTTTTGDTVKKGRNSYIQGVYENLQIPPDLKSVHLKKQNPVSKPSTNTATTRRSQDSNKPVTRSKKSSFQRKSPQKLQKPQDQASKHLIKRTSIPTTTTTTANIKSFQNASNRVKKVKRNKPYVTGISSKPPPAHEETQENISEKSQNREYLQVETVLPTLTNNCCNLFQLDLNQTEIPVPKSEFSDETTMQNIISTFPPEASDNDYNFTCVSQEELDTTIQTHAFLKEDDTEYKYTGDSNIPTLTTIPMLKDRIKTIDLTQSFVADKLSSMKLSNPPVNFNNGSSSQVTSISKNVSSGKSSKDLKSAKSSINSEEVNIPTNNQTEDNDKPAYPCSAEQLNSNEQWNLCEPPSIMKQSLELPLRSILFDTNDTDMKPTYPMMVAPKLQLSHHKKHPTSRPPINPNTRPNTKYIRSHKNNRVNTRKVGGKTQYLSTSHIDPRKNISNKEQYDNKRIKCKCSSTKKGSISIGYQNPYNSCRNELIENKIRQNSRSKKKCTPPKSK